MLSVNASMVRILEYSREELLGLTFPEFTHPDDIAAGSELAERLLAGEIPSGTLETRFITKTGKVRYGNLSDFTVR